MRKRIVIATLLGLICMWNGAFATEELQFAVSKEKIDLVRIWIYPNGGYGVDIELKPQYQKEFSVLTGANKGRKLQILLSGQPLITATIDAQITSGRIVVGKWDSPQQALKVVQEILLSGTESERY